VELNCRLFGHAAGGRPDLVLLHGLFGSSANWQSIARRFETERRVIVPDLRNHGRSPHGDVVDYPSMAGDVRALLAGLDAERPWIVGHSMGGKVAMRLALEHPEAVAGLMVVDIAPVAYPNRFGAILQAMADLPLDRIGRRSEADALLAAAVPGAAIRAYLLQNLDRDPEGRWRWRLNVAALRAGIEDIMDFPEPPPGARYAGPTRFVYGGDSDYLQPEHAGVIRRWFPNATSTGIPNAGHWVYADRPSAFAGVLRSFLSSGGASGHGPS
jgi:pimeloyl-ACP methyl ester carboxylesterase